MVFLIIVNLSVFGYDSLDAFQRDVLNLQQEQIVVKAWNSGVNYFIIFDVDIKDIDYLKDKIEHNTYELSEFIAKLIRSTYQGEVIIKTQDLDSTGVKEKISEYIQNTYRVEVVDIFFLASYQYK